MRPRLSALAARQGGLITRQQALAHGYLEGEIRTLTGRDGPWVLVRRGVYAPRELVERSTSRDAVLGLRDRAAHLTMSRPHLMSHDSAARAWGLPMLRPETDLVHVTRFGVGGSRTEEGVKHHLTRLGLLDAAELRGLKCTSLARTALDLGREHGLTAGVVACDAARQRGSTLDDFAGSLAHMWCWPGVRSARAAVELSDPGGETVGETLLRLLLLELDLGVPETQFPVSVAGGVAWADIRIGRHFFEFDGKLKFVPPERGGVAREPAEDVVWRERRRQHEMCAHGMGMSRATWDDVWGRNREAAGRRMVAEYQQTVDRYGTDLPPSVAEFAARVRTSRPRSA